MFFLEYVFNVCNFIACLLEMFYLDTYVLNVCNNICFYIGDSYTSIP
jgi:hypothetical protein